MKKILIIVLVVLLVGICATVVAFAVKGNDNNNSSDNSNEDLQSAYDRGYADAKTDKAYLDKLIVQNSDLEREKKTLIADKDNLTADVARLTQERDNLLSQNEALQQTVDDKDDFIKDLTDEKAALIAQNNAAISSLNAQITQKQTEIDNLNIQITNNAMTVKSLNDTIAKLQADIAEYQEYLALLDDPNRARVSFYFGGGLYAIRSVPKGSKVVIENPQSSDTLIFHNWTINGVDVDLSTYIFNENTEVVAKETRYHVVKFMSNGVLKDTKYIEDGQYVTTTPTVELSDRSFDYWTTDGNTQVFFESLPITADITFIAKFHNIYWAEFVYADGTPVIQRKRVDEGATTSVPSVPASYGRFNGWRVNDVLVDAANYKFYADTVFVADITPIYTVKFVESTQGTTLKTEMVYAGDFATIPDVDYDNLLGWTVSGVIVDVSTYPINANTTFTTRFGTLRQLDLDADDLIFAPVLENDRYHIDISVEGLTAGNKVAVEARSMTAFIEQYLDENETKWNESYAYNRLGDTDDFVYDLHFGGEWCYHEGGESCSNRAVIMLSSLKPFSAELGVYATGGYNYAPNTFTIYVSCTKDNVLTISWDDNAGFYLFEEIGIIAVYVWE